MMRVGMNQLFGDDLDVLKDKGEAVARVLRTVRGAADTLLTLFILPTLSKVFER